MNWVKLVLILQPELLDFSDFTQRAVLSSTHRRCRRTRAPCRPSRGVTTTRGCSSRQGTRYEIGFGLLRKRVEITLRNKFHTKVHVGWVSSQVASLQLLSRLRIHRTLKEASNVQLLPLPCRMQNLIGMLFTQTIRVRMS